MSAPEKITVVVITSPIEKDRLMHALDVFESWKILIDGPIQIEGPPKEGETLATSLQKMREVIEEDKNSRVIAIFHPYLAEGSWCDQSVLMVSDGHQFCKFADYLSHFHYVGPMPSKYLDRPVLAPVETSPA